MKQEKRLIEYILNTKNPYQLKVGDTLITMQYSENSKKFDQCILNILTKK